MRKRKVLASIIAALLITGCAGTRFTWDQARSIRSGMTEAEITTLMGPPNAVRSSAGQQVWVWVWVDAFIGTRTVSVVMKDGLVAEKPEIPASF